MKQSKILYLAAEVSPFVKEGGLADVTGALPKEIKSLNQEIRMMMPKYKQVNERKFVLREVIRLRDIPVTINGRTEIANVKSAFLPDSKVQIYFVEVGDFFNRPGIFKNPKTNEPYEDNPERFAFFNKAALETLKKLSWQPDIIHSNDWQTAFAPVYLKTIYHNDPFFKGVKSIFTFHNLSSQGSFDVEKTKNIEFDESQVKEGGMFYKDGKLNLTRAAIFFSDFITTVSENYAHEIIGNDEFGFGFGKVLDEKGEKFEGILNGVDYSVWTPTDDKLIPHQYTGENTELKNDNKKVLMERLGMPFRPETPLFVAITNLSSQKGTDLFVDILEKLLSLDVQICIMGEGNLDYMRKINAYNQSYPDKISFNATYDEKMSHLLLAGADFYLMPSKYEPCGLNQIYSLKYGTIPIVTPVGGLYDTVQDLSEDLSEGTGIVLKSISSEGLMSGINKAISIFNDKTKLTDIRIRIMDEDFSWKISAKRYVGIYETITTS